MRQTISIPASLTSAAHPTLAHKASRKPIGAAMLAAAGLTKETDDTHSGANLRLGDLATALGFHPHELTQVRSAPLDNPPQQVQLDRATLTLHYENPGCARDDENANVTAHVRLQSENKGPA